MHRTGVRRLVLPRRAVPLEAGDLKKFQQLPKNGLRQVIEASIVPAAEIASPAQNEATPCCGGAELSAAPDYLVETTMPVTANGSTSFARMRMTDANVCPMLTSERWCSVQAEYGEALLPRTCAVYLRMVRAIGGVEEQALALSCPEAARLVLLHEDLLGARETAVDEIGADEWRSSAVPANQDTGEEKRGSLQNSFWAIRNFALQVVRERKYALWQRLFLLGLFCKQLNAVTSGAGVAELLREFAATMADGALCQALDALPLERTRQLDFVLRLAGSLLGRSNMHARFAECIAAFTAGIGNGPAATMESLSANYGRAHDQTYAPFFSAHPQILENYLMNAIFRNVFPLGAGGMRQARSRRWNANLPRCWRSLLC